MILYTDTIGLNAPTEGFINSSASIDFGDNTSLFSLEVRKFGSIATSSFQSDYTTKTPSVLYDYRNTLQTDFTSLKTFETSANETFYTSNNKLFKTADAGTDIGLRYEFTDTSTFDFIAFHAPTVNTAATVKVFATDKNVIFLTSASKTFLTSNGNVFLTADNPNDSLGLVKESTISSSGWTIIDFGSSPVTTDIVLLQLSGSFDVELSEIFMGERYELPRNFEVGLKTGAKPRTSVLESYSGFEYANKENDDEEFYQYQFSLASETVKDSIRNIIDKGKDQRILIEDDSEYRYAFSSNNPFVATEVASGLYDIQLNFTNDRA
tara:strand:+ start:2011 stop:2979 length:969 start_codon:yes stop_codon:yes gene_type:complete